MRCRILFSLALSLMLSSGALHAQGRSLEQLKDACDNTANRTSATKACRTVLASPDAEDDDKKQAWESLAQIAIKEDRFNDALEAVNAAMRIDAHDCTLFMGRGVVQWA